MVVPTEKVSIYSRVWCAYEAYLGIKEEKIIFMAHRPMRREMMSSLVVGALLACIAVIAGYLSQHQAATSTWHELGAHLCWMLNIVGSMPLQFLALLLARQPRISSGLNILGVTVAAWALGATSISACLAPHTFEPQAALTHLGSREWPYGFLHISSIVFFMANEVDRLRFVSSRLEADQLQNNLHEIRHCGFTVQADYDNIMAEIGDKEDEVNRSIAVLIDAGMSTPALRRTAEYGVDLRDAANLRLAVGWLGFSYWCAVTFMLGANWPFSLEVPVEAIIIDWALKLLCFLTWLCKGWDEKAFIGSAVTKIVMPNVTVFLLFQIISSQRESQEPRYYPVTCSLLALFVNALALVCALLGRHRVAAIPLIGPTAARLLGPGCRVCSPAARDRLVTDSACNEEVGLGKRGRAEVCREEVRCEGV